MGEIADGLINGDFDFHTGEYLGRGGGFPRTFNKSLPHEQQSRKSSDLSWLKVTSYINSQGLKSHLHPKVVQDYGIEYKGKHPLRNACFEILKDFDKFKEWVKNYNLPTPNPE